MGPIAAQFYSPSLELIMLIIAIVINLFLAVAIFLSNPRSATNVIFSALTVFTMIWLILTYVARLPGLFIDSLVLHRLGIFVAAPMSASFFLLAHTMPSEKIRLRPFSFILVLAGTFLMMLFNVSPYAFVDIAASNGTSQPQPGPGLIPFSVLSTLFSVLAVYWLVRGYRHSSGREKTQQGLVLTGMIIMLVLIIATVLVPIILYSSAQFLTFTPLYALVFLGMTAYAITKYQLFNIKVLVAQALTLVMCLVLFAKLFGEESFNAQVIDGLVLLFMIVFGYFLVKSVKREVRQRELIEKQEQELEVANRQQENLLHFISHEVKGYLTKNEAAFDAIRTGDFGDVSPQLRDMSAAALSDTRRGVATVIDILDASNMKKGTVAYNKRPFDLVHALDEVVSDLAPSAREKGIELSFHKPVTGAYTFSGDEDKLRRHVFRNIIDNSIKYTSSGSIRVDMARTPTVYRISVTDTGVGITPDDMKNLFTEGGHGADSIRINVHSTGYGLFIARQVTEAHGGKIWAESEGKDKGSRFITELPVTE